VISSSFLFHTVVYQQFSLKVAVDNSGAFPNRPEIKLQMCDYDSDYSDINLYDIPEFPGHDQLQVSPKGEHDIRASNEGAEQCLSKTGADSEDDVIFILNKPAQATPRPDGHMVDDTAHHDQVSHSHVTNFGQPNPNKNLQDHNTHLPYSELLCRNEEGRNSGLPTAKTSAGNHCRST
jgi:hypothetical protein